ncbi:anti-sigma regulatory factor [Vibrio sp. Of14-4]|uniref:anti-sigma regulatory factor n=1 Tax=Vibrio sp. Of14-4 TaxID=2724878 RepID=UPI001EF2AEF1|nr:anti-sigma regulatory factor [Vibrio sp. Of14-4]MCG7488433.1 anti-sigma regulatory factor [Vibrio sp. Of14-4]
MNLLLLGGWVKENAKLDIVTDSDVGYASLDAKLFAQQLGFSTVDQYMISIAVSELTRNILNHAGRGFLYLKSVQEGEKIGVEIIAKDNGGGIRDLEKALSDNYSTGGTMGVGLPGTKRLMDSFHIDTELGVGTAVTVRKWLKQ